MARSGKRKFGVKRKASGGGKKSPAASRTFGVKGSVATPKRKFGVKERFGGIPGVTGTMESCPEGCPGEYIKGMWIHSKECRWSAVLWRVHDKTAKDWQCPFGCPPQELSSGWTHQWDCEFWERTGRTPFDHNKPRDMEYKGIDFKAKLAKDRAAGKFAQPHNLPPDPFTEPLEWDEYEGDDDTIPF